MPHSLTLATKRGLGAHPGKLYGIFTPPTLTPLQLRLTGGAFTACLLAACLPLAPRVFLFLAYILSFCYFPQLYAESTLSGHSSILIPSVLFLLCCSPSLDHEVRSRSEWPLQLLRIYLASGYFSSGMCKLLCGARFGRFWGKGTTLQMYIFDSMWSRPAWAPVRALQCFLIRRPRLSTLAACAAVAFESGFILAPFSDEVGVVFGAHGLLFHLGIHVLQGLDFTTWWSPALLVFFVGIPSNEPFAALHNGWQHELPFFLPAAIYTALQVLTAVTLRDFWLDDVLPFSCCPMFMLPRSIYDDWPKWWTMTDSPLNGSRTRMPGSMEPLYWSPASPIFEMPPEEAKLLPQRVLWFGSTTGCPREVLKFIKPECRNREVLIFANFELSAQLKGLLHQTMAEVNCGDTGRAYDDGALQRLLALQQECLEAFEACVREDKARQQPRVEARVSKHAVVPPSSSSSSDGSTGATTAHAKDE